MSPDFSPSITEYGVVVGNEVEYITVGGETADAKASLGGDSGKAIGLSVGTTVVKLVVTAEDGTTTKTYTISVVRAGPAEHSVSFDKNAADAAGSMQAQLITKGSSAALDANAFARPGYDFAGWASSPGGEVAYADGASVSMGGSDITLYALWSAKTYALKFDPNGGSGAMTDMSFTYGVRAQLELNAFSLKGNEFKGWSTSRGGPMAYENGQSYAIGAADATLYAVWTPHIYWIDFSAGHGSGTEKIQKVAYGSTVKLELNTFEYADHHFVGWSTVSNGSTLAYADGAEVTMGDKDLGLFAIWAINTYSVSFDSNGGTGDMSPQSIAVGTGAWLKACEFAKLGSDFAGWATEKGGAKAYDDGGDYIMGSVDATLYAIWTPHLYTVTFLADDGSGTKDTRSYAYGVATKLKANDFGRYGCVFAGWATSSGGPIAYADQASYTQGASNLSLYAIWKASGAISMSLVPMGSGAVDFTGSLEVVKGETLSVSVSTTGLGGFAWYLDGSVQSGQTNASLALGTAGLVPGPHSLMVLAVDSASMQYSASLTFRVTN